MKILHIHTNSKFLTVRDFYEFDSVQNDNLFIGVSLMHKWIDFRVKSSVSGLKKAIKIANDYDLILLHDLDYAKAYIANRVNRDIPVIWRFFGYELYRGLPHLMFTEKTKALMEIENANPSFFKKIKTLLSKVNSSTKKVDNRKEYEKAYKRIDYFHCLSEAEYDFLNQNFDLPEFLQIPYQLNIELEYNPKGGNKILIGNNRSPYNNHFDILDIVKNYPEVEKYSFLNYGPKNHYYQELIKAIEGIENYTAITKFLSLKEFEKFYDEIDAFVLNGHRQMATGNIAAAFQYGVKIYLSKHNAYYSLLKDNDFLVFDVDDLDEDLKNKNITLTKEQARQNIEALNRLNEIHGIDVFISRAKEIVKDRQSVEL